MAPYTTSALPPNTASAPTNTTAAPTSSSSSSPSSAAQQPAAMYDLSSVIVHKGKLDSGHYVSYSREADDWFLFDDSKVVLAAEREVLDANAYLLFYIARSFET